MDETTMDETTSVHDFGINDLSANEQVYVKGHLLELIGKAMQAVSEARHYAQDVKLLDSQDYLNFEDALNQISVADPNNK